ncbi:ATP-binding protein [Salinigranum salinum]|uniref:ATP-binding protein n=1 Tax=Salinigranum salinum TaxID=1364937 RepID=UPI001260480D|nr:PAS domain-containing sensor histidine kinase [Salinigranum salinum]
MRLDDGGTPPGSGYETLLSRIPELVVVVDAAGEIRYVGPSARTVVGHEPDTLVGTSLVDHLHETDAMAVELLVTAETAGRRDDLERAPDDAGAGERSSHGPSSVEARIRTGDGEWIWLQFATTDEWDDETDSVVLTARNVTDRRRRERQLAERNDRLDTFASVVSHDLQGPLSVASGTLALYRQTGDEAYLDRIERAHERMEELTGGLLALAREGRVVGDLEPVSLSACATRALETTPLSSDGVVVDPALPTVSADPSRLRSLFENLFRNVVDHAGPDARVWIAPLDEDVADSTTEESQSPAARGDFVFEDDGPGIPPDEADTVFEPGYSTDDGTGYGLHIVDTIATAHGWDVTVTTGRAGGARFEVRGVDAVETDE